MRIAIYSRKSKETDTGESIKNQIKMCTEYFNRQYDNCTFEVFEDEGFSGGNTNRPSFKRMMNLAKHKQFDIIAAYRLDRISRNTLDFLMMFEELKEYDIQLISVTEGFDASTPAGKMMMSMVSSMAEMERMNIAQRVKDNMNELAKVGRWSGGTVPTGYKSITIQSEGGKKETYLELIPEMEDNLKFIFNRVTQGYTTFQIGKDLNMSPKTVHNIINNPVYVQSTIESAKYLESIGYTVHGNLNGCGFMPYNRRPKKGSKKLFNAKGMFVSVSIHKAIIEPSVWIKANNNLMARGQEQKPRISENTFLAHMVKCKCGGGMFVHQGSKKASGERVYYFRCSNQKGKGVKCDSKWLRIEYVESAAKELLENIELDNTKVSNYSNSFKKINYDKLIKEVNKKIIKKRLDIEKLTEKLIIIEGSAIEIISNKINSISREIENYKNDLLELEKKKDKQKEKDIDSNEIRNSVIASLEKSDIKEKQILIKNIFKEIRYDGVDTVEFVLVG